ncbi:MAG TPA: RusA family crossover junction endodeoxyribonuclease [Candidatus Saccharimonadales bacterium]|nr:RusA family crossover junction endodeoxyribonuclease [Candidatus Saccharimonadales bacterium]
MAHCFEGTIYGQVYSKANSRRLVRRGNRTISIKSERALDFEENAIQQLQLLFKNKKPIEGELVIECTIFYPSQRQDLDASLVFDVLQKAGVIVNDRQLREQHLFHAIDKANPRVDIAIWERG